MPLIIENGTGVANADSWVDEADTTDYWTDRLNAAWIAASVPQREAALRNAADYLTLVYRWPGQPTTLVQRLPWPRSGVRSGSGWFPSNDIPTQIIDSQMLLAIEALGGDILRRVPVAPQLIEETKAAKGLSKTLKYATAPVDSISGIKRFATIDNILKGIAIGGTSTDFGIVQLVRGR